MYKRGFQFLLGMAGSMVLLACHYDGLAVHGCPTDYSFNWKFHNLSVEHTEPATCPVYIPAPGTQKRTGATIVDGGDREYGAAEVRVRDAAGGPLDGRRSSFGWDSNNRWVAQPYVDYLAGTLDLRPDIGRFQLYDFGGAAGPWAEMQITYTDRVKMAVQGPGAVASGSTVTYSADITAGSAPFTYRWYLDWELVGTESSYTTTLSGDGKVELRLDVFDDRGESDSDLIEVWVSSCSDTGIIC